MRVETKSGHQYDVCPDCLDESIYAPGSLVYGFLVKGYRTRRKRVHAGTVQWFYLRNVKEVISE